jgi:hypothetical protein
MGAAATTDQMTGAAPLPERRQVKDGTAYWTLSFYISRAQIEDHPLAMRFDPKHFGKADGVKTRDELIENFPVARHFTDYPKWKGGEPLPEGESLWALNDLRQFEAFDSRARWQKLKKTLPRAQETKQLQGAINPLFNDIADRSRLGRIEDQLFAAGQEDRLHFVLPESITWSTEGQTFAVPTVEGERGFETHVKRFWYLHGNGSLSWHVSFDVHYRNDAFQAALDAKTVPHALYLLSMMQKLAYPKEKEIERKEDGDNPVRSDRLFELRLAEDVAPFSGKDDDPTLFWNRIKRWFGEDKDLLSELYQGKAKKWEPDWFPYLCPHMAINEIPGLFCVDTRSNFFIQDKQFFELIQPRSDATENKGELVERRTRILDPEFEIYPNLVDPKCGLGAELKTAEWGKRTVELGKTYWQAVLQGTSQSMAAKASLLTPEQRLLYLFLAGFNQNIIDWTNQEASEVLDSLDPIYPKSAEQLEEGFFIRYANPRCLITYVQRSRTLEVGNDFIGTCPYAFLIHVLAMHNERLTRDQEKLAFAVVEKVNSYVREAQAALSKLGNEAEPQGQAAATILRRVGRTVQDAEAWINWYRMAAFEHFDRHRYVNPFRYDTERDVFNELETLRGTSRLEKALEKAFGALDESTRDLERVRAEAEREQERQDDKAREVERELADSEQRMRDRKMTVLFGIVGLSGLGQLAFNIHQYVNETVMSAMSWRDYLLIGVEVGITAAVLLGTGWYFWPKRKAATPPSVPEV